MTKRTKISALLFAISIVLFAFCSYSNVIAKQSNQSQILEVTSDHILTLFDNSHYNRPIYANHSIVNLTLLFQSPEINSSSHVYIHLSYNMINWTTLELQKRQHLTSYSAFYDVSLGPFLYEGEYYITFNATQGSSELANGYLRINVEKAVGIVFVDFSYRIKIQDNITQYADLYINVLGDDIKLGSVYVASDQQPEGDGALQQRDRVPPSVHHGQLQRSSVYAQPRHDAHRPQSLRAAGSRGGNPRESRSATRTVPPRRLCHVRHREVA